MRFIAIATTLVTSAALAAPPEFIALPAGTRAFSVSDDGKTVVGTTASAGFRWTLDGGYQTIAGPAATSGTLVAVSGDGLEITADVLDANNKQHAALWEGGSTWSQLPAFVSCDAFLLNSYDINVDGSIVVGLAWIAGCQAHAFRWDPVNGTVDLGTLVAGRSSRANAVNSVGDIIVGWQDMANGTRRGARWIDGVESYMPSYVAPGGATHMVGEALGVSRAGDRIVGYNVFGLAGGNAWKWDGPTNTVSTLPQLAGFSGNAALANGITDDGTRVVGTTGGFLIGRKALVWDNGAVKDIKTLVEENGGSIAPYNSLGTAMAVSPDGRTIVGFGFGTGQPAGWIVRFPADCPADFNSDGSVGADDLGVLLGAWGGRGAADLDNSGTVDAADLGLLLGAWGPCGG
jgi:probable HAF family extracellular repeat protein